MKDLKTQIIFTKSWKKIQISSYLSKTMTGKIKLKEAVGKTGYILISHPKNWMMLGEKSVNTTKKPTSKN